MCFSYLEGGENGREDLVSTEQGVGDALGTEGGDEVVEAEQRQQQQGGAHGLQRRRRWPIAHVRPGAQLDDQHSHNVAQEDEAGGQRQAHRHHQHPAELALVNPTPTRNSIKLLF